MTANEPHPYTVDVVLHGAEPYPCVICGGERQAGPHVAYHEACSGWWGMIPPENLPRVRVALLGLYRALRRVGIPRDGARDAIEELWRHATS